MKRRYQITSSYVLELAVGLAVLVAVNLIWWPDDPAFESIWPHPYWLVILPLAVNYGFVEGATAALACAGVYIAWTWSVAPEFHWLLFFTIERLKIPAVFLIGGMVCGEFRERHRRRERNKQDRLDKLEGAVQDLAVRHLSVAEAKRELELRILSQDQTVQTLYQAAEGLERLEEGAIFPAVLDMLVDHLGVTLASVYLLKDGELELAVAKGPGPIDQLPQKVSRDNGLMGKAIESRRIETVDLLLRQEALHEFEQTPILVSGPLVVDGKDVIGVINVHKLPFLRFTPAAIRMAGLLSEWASIALTNARKYKKAADGDVNDELTGTHTSLYLEKRLQEEFFRAKRYGTTLSVIVVKIVRMDEVDEKLKPDLLSMLGATFNKCVRNVDLVFRGKDNNEFVLMLPVTPINGCQVVVGRIRTEIDAFKFRPYVNSDETVKVLIGAAEVMPEMGAPSALLDYAREQMV